MTTNKTVKKGKTAFENELTDLWAKLNPVAGYTSGWVDSLAQLFIATPARVKEALQAIQALEKRTGELTQPELRETARKQLVMFQTQLECPQPGMGVQDCGDGAFYIGLKKAFEADFVPRFLESACEKVAFETKRLDADALNILQRKQCVDAAAYCASTMEILAKQNPKLKDGVREVLKRTEAFKRKFMVPGLDAEDFATLFFTLRQHTTGPSFTPGYPQMLAALYDFTQSGSDLDLTAMTWLSQEMPIVKELARELGVLLGLPAGSTVGQVWDTVSQKYAVQGDYMACANRMAKACNAYAARYLLDINPSDKVVMQQTPSYMAPVITGGQDIAVDYLTTKPVAYIYLTPAKSQSALTMLNIMVHEYSHGFNFVLAAKHAGSPLLNLMSPMQVPLTEGQAFYREWEYWAAAANAFGQADLSPEQKDYLALYGDTPLEQAQAIRAAQLETYIWRIVRYIRALCDVQVNMGWRTFVDFLDWASGVTGLTAEFLYGECFTFLAQPGYAPAYAIDGIEYGQLQTEDDKRLVTQKHFDTTASAMGFYPWTLCARRLKALPVEVAALERAAS